MSDIFILGTLLTQTQSSISAINTLSNIEVLGIATLPNLTYSSINFNKLKFGNGVGYTNQQTGGIAIGEFAGQISQGTNSIAIGQFAGQTNQNQSTIVLNASGTGLNTATNNAFYVSPIRDQTVSTNYLPLTYNTTTKEIISVNQLNLQGSFSINTNVLYVDMNTNRVGINQSSPVYGFHSTGQTHQFGVLRISNNAVATETAVRGQIVLDDTNLSLTLQNNGVNRYSIENQGWLVVNSLSTSHPSSLNAIYGFTGNNLYIGSNNGSVVFRNTGSNSDIFSVDNSGDITIGSLSVVHSRLNSNQMVGYAMIQNSGDVNNTYGPFRRTSAGYVQVTNASSFYDINFSGSTQSLFNYAIGTPDNVGGNLTIFCKRFGNLNGANAIFSVFIAKVYGQELRNNFKQSGTYSSNWTSTPTLGGGTGNVIRINFNTSDTTSPQGTYVAWTFEGFN